MLTNINAQRPALLSFSTAGADRRPRPSIGSTATAALLHHDSVLSSAVSLSGSISASVAVSGADYRKLSARAGIVGGLADERGLATRVVADQKAVLSAPKTSIDAKGVPPRGSSG